MTNQHSTFFATAFSTAIVSLSALAAPAMGDLITNGDFESGTSGWTTGYYVDSNPGAGATGGEGDGAGVVGVVAYSKDWHGSFASFNDHTFAPHAVTGTNALGHMLIVNGSHDANNVVWEEDGLNIHAGKTYQLTFWATSAYFDSPAVLDLTVSVNGLVQAFSLPGGDAAGTWAQYSVQWVANGGPPADISFTDSNTVASGNDFALDDISLCEVVPLPPAAWSGMACLAGVGVFGFARRRYMTRC